MFEIGDRVVVRNITSQFHGWRGEVYRVQLGAVWAKVREGKYESCVCFDAASLAKIYEVVTA